MTIKSLLITSVLALSVAGLASAKSYFFTLTGPAVAGTNQLKAGEYEVKVQGSDVVLTDEVHGKSITIPVTVEQNGKKFADTEVETTTKNGTDNIHSIALGGSTTKIVLGQ